MRTWVYVDGFNLYYGALKGTPYKWLNLKSFCENIFPDGHRFEKIKYFTARVSGAQDADAPKRQDAYLRALRTLPEIEIIYGSFLAKTTWRPLMNLPVANRPLHFQQRITLASGTYRVDGTRGPQSLPISSYPVRTSNSAFKRAKNRSPLPDAVISEVHVEATSIWLLTCSTTLGTADSRRQLSFRTIRI